MFIPNHTHILVKGFIKHPPKKEYELNAWFKELVNKVRMNVIAGPTSVYVDDLGNEGLTGTVTLATSHASMHIWDAQMPAFFQMDLYSCTDFKASEVIEEIDKFGIISADWILLDRNLNFKILEISGIIK